VSVPKEREFSIAAEILSLVLPLDDDDQLNVIADVVGAWIYQRDRKSLSGRHLPRVPVPTSEMRLTSGPTARRTRRQVRGMQA